MVSDSKSVCCLFHIAGFGYYTVRSFEFNKIGFYYLGLNVYVTISGGSILGCT